MPSLLASVLVWPKPLGWGWPEGNPRQCLGAYLPSIPPHTACRRALPGVWDPCLRQSPSGWCIVSDQQRTDPRPCFSEEGSAKAFWLRIQGKKGRCCLPEGPQYAMWALGIPFNLHKFPLRQPAFGASLESEEPLLSSSFAGATPCPASGCVTPRDAMLRSWGNQHTQWKSL